MFMRMAFAIPIFYLASTCVEAKIIATRHMENVNPFDNSAIEVINKYFEDFETLAKSEKWKEILSQGTAALKAAETAGRTNDQAKICAQLTSTTFYLGDYTLALKYANRCHELSQEFVDPSLFIRALYLESAVHRALAGKNTNEQAQQKSYQLAVTTAEE